MKMYIFSSFSLEYCFLRLSVSPHPFMTHDYVSSTTDRMEG